MESACFKMQYPAIGALTGRQIGLDLRGNSLQQWQTTTRGCSSGFLTLSNRPHPSQHLFVNLRYLQHLAQYASSLQIQHLSDWTCPRQILHSCLQTHVPATTTIAEGWIDAVGYLPSPVISLPSLLAFIVPNAITSPGFWRFFPVSSPDSTLSPLVCLDAQRDILIVFPSV